MKHKKKTHKTFVTGDLAPGTPVDPFDDLTDSEAGKKVLEEAVEKTQEPCDKPEHDAP